MLSLVLIVPGLVVAYALLLRPVLRKLPAFERFYAQADGFWAKVWALCGNSLTVAWGYVLGGLGSLLALSAPLADYLAGPDFANQVASLHLTPQVMGYITIAVSVLTLLARLRGIAKG